MSFVTTIILFVLPALISCQNLTLETRCINISCPNYKSKAILCRPVTHIEDPFSNECVPKCDGPCVNGTCEYCYCRSDNELAIHSAQLSECKRLLMNTICLGYMCHFSAIKSCNSNYTHNPYNLYECLQRCDEDSCGEGGTCSSRGHCICHLGYRPDIKNPRHCIKIPEENITTIRERTCHKGFKLSDEGKCVSACGECKNGCCGSDGVCQCWDGYELDDASSICVAKAEEEVKMICSADTCLDGVCDSGGVCQCPDCSDFIGEDCQNELNSTVGDVDADRNCGNTASSGDVILRSTHKTSVTILSCVTVILSIGTIALALIALKIKRELPSHQAKIKILFGGLE